MSILLEDGNYTIEVTLSGGSGKAAVESPAELYVENGMVQEKIVWSSSNYDYMEIDGIGYYPIDEEENSIFLINVTEFDCDVPILAETVAMSEPHMIEYTLYFDSSTVKETGFPLLTGIFVGVVVLIAAAAAAWILKRGRKSSETDV